MKFDDSNPIETLSFENYTEAIDIAYKACDKFPKGKRNLDYGFSFTHAYSVDHAYKMASEGWPEGYQLFKAIADRIEVASHVMKPETFFDTTGDYGFDMGRVMSGEPENILNVYETEDISNNGPIISIGVNVVASGVIESSVLIRRGAAILALIDALEQSGKRIELDALYYIGSNNFRGIGHKLIVPLKRPDFAAQPDQIAFALAHPAFMRIFMFSALALAGAHGYSSAGSACGSFANRMPEPINYDLWIPAAIGWDAQWLDNDSAVAWITAQLAKFGVTLSETGKGRLA